VKEQTAFTRAYLDRIPQRDAIRRRLTTLWNASATGVPWREAGRLFFTENPGLQQQPALYEQDGPEGAPRLIFDPQRISPDGSVAVGDYVVSPDGRRLAYSVSKGGADAGETRVRDLATDRDLPDTVVGGGICWTKDARGFFYKRSTSADPADAPDTARIVKQLYYHVLGRPPEKDRLLHEWRENYRWLYAMLSDDGRWAIVVAERGANAWMYAVPLGETGVLSPSARLVPLTGGEAAYTPIDAVGDTLYAVTDREAPRRRVIALDLRQGTAAGARTVVPESADVIDNAALVGDRLVVHYLGDVQSRLRLFTLDGKPAGEIALPGIGAVGWPMNGRPSARELYYSFTSYLLPETVYRYDLTNGVSRPFRPPRTTFDARAYETRQVFYRSKDGARVPMFVTAKKSLRLTGRNPTMLTGYGGYGSVMTPQYRPDVALWLESGGIYAVASIRGGGEYGEEWHRAGSLERKQNSFDDFIAAAEYLIARRYTSAGKLAIYGHSNGGLLVGAVATQRPDLFAVAIANAGHHDMLRYHRFTAGAGWIPEYGSPDDPAAFRYLRAYSPLHNVRKGRCYPATLLLVADHDDRVVPSHSYKFAAALQAAQECDRPILLRVARDASHSYASATAAIDELSDLWAFTSARLRVPMTATGRQGEFGVRLRTRLNFSISP